MCRKLGGGWTRAAECCSPGKAQPHLLLLVQGLAETRGLLSTVSGLSKLAPRGLEVSR